MALDKSIDITGWHAAWLTRSLPAFTLYTNLTLNTLLFATCALGLATFFRLRSYNSQLKADPSNRASIFSRLDATVLKGCRANWYIAVLYLVNAFAISCVDAYIGVVALKEDVGADPQGYDREFVTEAVLYCAYLTVVFLTTFFFVPLMQMLVVTSFLAGYMRRKGLTSLARHVLEARVYSTNIALMWTTVLFFVMAWWVPSDDGSLARWIVLQAAMGSSIAWLDASYAFNFCSDRFADKDWTVGDGRVMDIVRMFAETVKAAHTVEKGGEDVLPLHNGQAVVAANATVDEKTPLTV
ncbi:hypothetical protein LTR62_005084 [Meristemomyces frigidus]|uniref:Uncharacterized protein n=1 Tax=Meristemomyces frigidus TaxID=1508187 RepID=A0AAN7YTK8_9PEZI|nr:hypothetical protein LTR62_005084 [Meristemomyces frigidus]